MNEIMHEMVLKQLEYGVLPIQIGRDPTSKKLNKEMIASICRLKCYERIFEVKRADTYAKFRMTEVNQTEELHICVKYQQKERNSRYVKRHLLVSMA
ncbi:hypothetical protein PR048_023007 [Dryococelus australis]|uniref:Uncharacterized protein n=1 Tax=Dryococelus australis TaxID=614101 RepID=A0ABQ9GSY9_9NEOP|nr:hypothetical protein PR048_023007 [Dryococelus australis]